MDHHPVLDQIALGYAPMIDRDRVITAVRLTVFATQPHAAPSANGLLAVLAEAWPAEAGRLSLNIADKHLLEQVLRCDLPPHLMLEVPAFMAGQLAQVEAIQALHQRGNTLLIKGWPTTPLSREALPCFVYSIIDLPDEQADGLPPQDGVSRNIPQVQAGVRSMAELAEAFSRGAIAALGWPIGPAETAPTAAPTPASAASGRPRQPPAAISTVVELINRVDRGESIERLEAVMKNDPTLAFRLLRYLNSPAFALRVEVTSFGHAIALLGYKRLKRWLALLLASGSGDTAYKPLVYAAVRRGLLMEELGRNGGADDAQRGDLFICGVFSLLDRMLHQPLAQLLDTIPTSDAVRDALQHERGPYQPMLALVQVIEAAALDDIRAKADALQMALPAVNRAVLRALVAARQLD
jgi:EAL and modified HD-GYP domain-containing signal transduction protein